MSAMAKMALAAALWCLVASGAMAAGDPGAARPARLKLQVQLDSGTVKASDLWINAGPKGDAVIGPAPPPGRTIAIETAQLAYIARLYDIDWRPTSGVERTSLERAGRPLSRDELSEPIRRAVVEAGAASGVTLDLGTFSPILVPPAAFPQVLVEGLSYDAAGERFSASIAVSTDGMPTERTRISGRVVHMVPAITATRRLQANEIIVAGDVREMPMAERRLPGPVLSDIGLVVGQSPKRTIVAGQAIAASDIGPPVLIAKGATVVLTVETPGLSMAAQGLALAPGGRDDVIQVMNPLSRAVVAARVTGPGRATIAPGATPLVPPVNTPRSPEVAN